MPIPMVMGVPDVDDDCPGTAPGVTVDADGCPIPDADGDGVTDANDNCPGTPLGVTVGPDGCPLSTAFTPVLTDVRASSWGDYNNDGWSDMVGGGNNVYTNQGDGTFVLTSPVGGIGFASLGDWNNDGLLDVGNLLAGSLPVLWLNNGDETWTNRNGVCPNRSWRL